MRIFILLMVVLFNQVLISSLNAELVNISPGEARENIRYVYKTQQEIADLFDVSQSTVSRFLLGKDSPKLLNNFNKCLNDSGLYSVLIVMPKNEWLKTLLCPPALTPRKKAVAVADKRSLHYVRGMYPRFIGWHGTSRHDLSLLHDKEITIPDASQYNPRQGPLLQYGPGFYVAEDEKVAAVFAQKRVSNIHPETEDYGLPIVVPVFWNSQILPEIYEAGEDLGLEKLKLQANRNTANGAVSRAINGKIDSLSPPDIVHGYIKDYETSTQHMFTRNALGKIQLGTAHPISNIPKATTNNRLSLR